MTMFKDVKPGDYYSDGPGQAGFLELSVTTDASGKITIEYVIYYNGSGWAGNKCSAHGKPNDLINSNQLCSVIPPNCPFQVVAAAAPSPATKQVAPAPYVAKQDPTSKIVKPGECYKHYDEYCFIIDVLDNPDGTKDVEYVKQQSGKWATSSWMKRSTGVCVFVTGKTISPDQIPPGCPYIMYGGVGSSPTRATSTGVKTRIEANAHSDVCVKCGGKTKQLFVSNYCPTCE